MTSTTVENPFEYRTTPKNNWELIWWAFSDGNKVEKHIESLKLNWWQERLLFLKIYFIYILPLICAVPLVLVFVFIFSTNLSAPTDAIFDNNFYDNWAKQLDFLSKIDFLFFEFLSTWIIFFSVIILSGIVISLFSWYSNSDLAFGFVFVFVFVLSLAFDFSLHVGLVLGASWGSLLGALLIGGLVVNTFRFFIPIFLSSMMGITIFSLLVHNDAEFLYTKYVVFYFLAGTFGVIGGILGSVIRVTLFILKSRYSKLDSNLYLIFNNIPTSLFAEKRLIKQSQEHPDLALLFADFLLTYRISQYNLAALLFHSAVATVWKLAALTLREDALLLQQFRRNGFTYPQIWQDKLTVIKNKLVIAEQTTQISLKKDLFIDFVQALEEFRLILLDTRQLTWRDKISMTRRIDWQKYYREAIEDWIRIAKQKLAEYEELVQRTEPISRNFYLTGDPIIPNRNEIVFMNRTDLHNELSLKIRTTSRLAVLFLQGQRRVGKTSLVKFLPKILGRRFEVVSLDLQSNITSIENFLFKLRREFNTQLGITEETEWIITTTWAAALRELYDYIGQYAQEKNIKIILTIDEYEYLQQHLSTDLAQAQEFLGAFRHFSQHQDHVSLMFVGLKFFSELQNPNWNEYFVNAVSIRVEYLNQEESFKLIEVSKLDFEAGAKEKIFELTQGHPALIQKICYEIVNIANSKGSKQIAWADVENALKKMIYTQDNGVTDIFWTQTCELPEDKEVVWAIIEKREIPKTHRLRLRRLIEYGFIVENEVENTYTLRVPIFEHWIKKFG